MSTHKFEFSGASSSRADVELERKLSSEVTELEDRLAEKKIELAAAKRHIEALKEARRDRAEERVLSELLSKVFLNYRDLSCLVDPEGGVEIIVSIEDAHYAEEFARVMSPMTDREIDVKIDRGLLRISLKTVTITFPFSKLESVKRGLHLSAPVDLRPDEPGIGRGRC